MRTPSVDSKKLLTYMCVGNVKKKKFKFAEKKKKMERRVSRRLVNLKLPCILYIQGLFLNELKALRAYTQICNAIRCDIVSQKDAKNCKNSACRFRAIYQLCLV